MPNPERKAWYQFWVPSRIPNQVHVVKGITLDIKDGEFLVLVGASGCGKSTTLRMVAGLEEVSSGSIYIGDRDVTNVAPKDRDIAMVFQSYALYPHFSVYDNMAFGLRVRKFSEEDIKERIDKAAKLLGIDHLLLRKPKELSGGQRQRVAMGRAIVRRPQVYLMDEPLSNLDAKLRVQMRAELQKMHQTLGVTTIYVTHDQTEAMTLGDRIVLMHQGIVQQAAPPLEMYEHPANKYVAGFIGTPSMNFMTVLLEAKDNDLLIKGQGFEIEIPERLAGRLKPFAGRECTLGLRPEDIYDPKFAREGEFMAPIAAKVEVYEPMGSEVSLHILLGGESLVALVDAHTEAKVGDVASLAIDTRKLHLFDLKTEKALL